MSDINVTIVSPTIVARVSGGGINANVVVSAGVNMTVPVGQLSNPNVMLVGTQGVAGASPSSYTHTQSIAAAIWTVPHNLSRKVSVTVVDNLENRVEPDVSYIDLNTVRVTHAAAVIGKVYCN